MILNDEERKALAWFLPYCDEHLMEMRRDAVDKSKRGNYEREYGPIVSTHTDVIFQLQKKLLQYDPPAKPNVVEYKDRHLNKK